MILLTLFLLAQLNPDPPAPPIYETFTPPTPQLRYVLPSYDLYERTGPSTLYILPNARPGALGYQPLYNTLRNHHYIEEE